MSRAISSAIFSSITSERDRVVLITDEMQVNLGQLQDLSNAFALRMRERGVDRSSIVAVNSFDVVVILATLLATSVLGCRWVLADKKLADEKPVAPTHFFRSPEAAGSELASFETIDPSWSAFAVKKAGTFLNRPFSDVDNDAGWLITKTSGTTGRPKFLELSQNNMLKRSQAVEDIFTKETVFSTLFECHTFPFLTRALACLVNRSVMVMSPNVATWEKYNVNHVFASPVQAMTFFSEMDATEKKPLLQLAGAKLTSQVAERMLCFFDRIEDVYASTESNRSYANLVGQSPSSGFSTVGCPRDSEVEIISDDGQQCPPFQIGTVRVRNEYLADRYLNNDEASDRAFIDGWFYPGDRGYFGQENELVITGRVDELVNFGGVKFDPTVADMLIKSVEGVADALCFANPRPGLEQQLVALVVLEKDTAATGILAAARSLCEEKLGQLIAPKKFFVVDALPSDSSGKHQRKLAQALAIERIEMNKDA